MKYPFFKKNAEKSGRLSKYERINIHGYISMTILMVALGIADYALFKISMLYGIMYTSVIVTGFLFISFFYCRKCSIRKNCNHLFPGLISGVVKYCEKPYKKSDLKITIFPILFMIGLPQYWLFHELILFIIFWFLLAIAGIEINLYVCKTCRNVKCPLSKYENV
jgi:hypothetical protein